MSHDAPENPILKLLAVPFLIVLGLFCLAGAFIPGARQWLDAWIGDVNFIYLGLGFLFFYTAVLVAEKNRLRLKFIALLEEIQRFFYGADHKQIAHAVEILISAIEKGGDQTAKTALAELKRLTGQDFGPDHAKWKAWWAENRERFLMARQNASLAGERKSHGSPE